MVKKRRSYTSDFEDRVVLVPLRVSVETPISLKDQFGVWLHYAVFSAQEGKLASSERLQRIYFATAGTSK